MKPHSECCIFQVYGAFGLTGLLFWHTLISSRISSNVLLISQVRIVTQRFWTIRFTKNLFVRICIAVFATNHITCHIYVLASLRTPLSALNTIRIVQPKGY